MTPYQVLEASRLTERQLQLDGVKDFISPYDLNEHDAVLRSTHLLVPSRYLGKTALLRLDKPFSLNAERAKWLYIISYHDEIIPQQLSMASVTIYAEKEPIVIVKKGSPVMDTEGIIEDLRSIQDDLAIDK